MRKIFDICKSTDEILILSLDVTLQSARPSDDGFILPNLNDSLPSLSCISLHTDSLFCTLLISKEYRTISSLH